jgi:mannose-6-phosphate isomerase-like protein (cupin superfamily)
MKRVFRIGEPVRAPDGTLVSPFLNPRDSTSSLPSDLPDGFSIAAGVIEPKSRSKIQVLPFVTQATFVHRGTLTVHMKGPADEERLTITVQPREAVLTEPGVFFQLVNEGDEPCDVLYITSPAYLFEVRGGKVIYDDTVILGQDWESLRSTGWRPPHPLPSEDQRATAERRLAGRPKPAGR